MRSAITVSCITRRTNRPVRGCIARLAFSLLAAAGILTATVQSAAAQKQSEAGQGWELIVPSGTLIPTGTHRDAIRRGGMTAIQVSYRVRPLIAVTTSLGWARSRDAAAEGDPKLDVFTYDIGAEVRAPQLPVGGLLSFRLFAGAGAGGRSYNYRSLDVNATHNLATYGSLGGELGAGRVHLRLEARDYVTGFKPLRGQGESDVRNDVALMFGLRLETR